MVFQQTGLCCTSSVLVAALRHSHCKPKYTSDLWCKGDSSVWENESACVFYVRAFDDLQPWHADGINFISPWEKMQDFGRYGILVTLEIRPGNGLAVIWNNMNVILFSKSNYIAGKSFRARYLHRPQCDSAGDSSAGVYVMILIAATHKPLINTLISNPIFIFHISAACQIHWLKRRTMKQFIILCTEGATKDFAQLLTVYSCLQLFASDWLGFTETKASLRLPLIPSLAPSLTGRSREAPGSGHEAPRASMIAETVKYCWKLRG